VEEARPAGSDDVSAIVGLARAAVAELTAQRGGAVWARREARQEPIEPGVAAAVEAAGPDAAALVGTIDGTVVGYAFSRIELLPGGERLAVVSDLYVDPGARGVGVGEALMDALVEHATARGAIGIDAIALPGDRATKNFFESFGLKARAIAVHRALGAAQATTPVEGNQEGEQ
jgi:ribosomal protein S18 acetylase RimI-like enzyme